MKKLKIIYITDTHGFLFPTDYISKGEKFTGLMNCAAKFVKDENTLIIDGGDTLQGSPFAYYYSKYNGSEIIAEFMNKIELGYFTLGNHDFNYGYDYLKKYVDKSKAQAVCANVKDKTSNIDIKSYVIVELENGLKIGIVGITTDFINLWEKKEHIKNFKISDTFDAVRKNLEIIRDKCDVKICLYHGGIEENMKTKELLSSTKENIAAKIARDLDFDLLLTGHQHMAVVDTILYNSHIVQSPAYAESFVEIEIKLNENKESEKLEVHSKLVKAASKPRIDLYEEFKKYNDKVEVWLDTPIAILDEDLKAEDKVKMAMEGSKLADFINKIQIFYTKADISITSFANEISGFPKKVTVRDIMMTYRFPNVLGVFEIDGKSLREALEQSYSYLEKNSEGEYVVSKKFLEPKVEHYNFDFFYGLDYEVDFNKKEYSRIGKIKFKGREIKDDSLLKIVMNDYRATGAGNYLMYPKLKKIGEIQREISELIIEYLDKFY